MRLQAVDVKLGYGDRIIVDGLDLGIEAGTVTTIIGPNGCGKSTLLRALGRLLKPHGRRGAARRQAHRPDAHPEVAKILGVLPQAPTAPGGPDRRRPGRQGTAPAPDVVPAVVVGRRGGGRRGAGHDRPARTWRERPLDELSGGQRQRAWISMALAQGTDLLLLDEPTTFLDLAHQVEVLELVRRLHRRARPDHRHGAARPQPGRPLRRPPGRHARRPGGRRRRPARGAHRGPAARRSSSWTPRSSRTRWRAPRWSSPSAPTTASPP